MSIKDKTQQDLMPDTLFNVKQVFSIDVDMQVPGYSQLSEHVPEIDPNYCFDRETTLPILAGFTHNRRVMVQGYHGTGKSTHIEQIAARLNWPCIRINLDGHLSRLDLIGRDTIAIEEGMQITQFQEGILPWALQRPVALVFDEYDVGRPDVMFIIHRILEKAGKFTLFDKNRVVHPHPGFRLFATANTVGLGNLTGLYHGTQLLNQAQVDRWNIVVTLNYLPRDMEVAIVKAHVPQLKQQTEFIETMIALADLTRKGFTAGDISTVMSPRTVITWAENYCIFNDAKLSFKLSFLNKCDEAEYSIFSEYYQRVFAEDIY